MATDKTPRRLKHKTIRPDLSLPEIRFCQIYAMATMPNATQAYLDAGFNATRRTAGEMAWRLLKKVEIGNYIRELRNDACEAAKVSVDALARSFREQGFADRTCIFDEAGRMTNPRTWPKELRSIIAGIEVDNIEEWRQDENGNRVKVVVGQNWKVKFERSTEAKKILAQWKGMIGTDKVEPDSNAPTDLAILGRLAALLAARQPIASGTSVPSE